jgi:hypothetical protein
MDGYKVCSFQGLAGKEFLVLDAIVSDNEKNQVLLQGFTSSGCYSFPLRFTVTLPEEKLLEQALIDGTNHVKGVKNWSGEEVEEEMKSLSSELAFLSFVRGNCKSAKLSADIDKFTS